VSNVCGRFVGCLLSVNELAEYPSAEFHCCASLSKANVEDSRNGLVASSGPGIVE
jgi:hypothetical protein